MGCLASTDRRTIPDSEAFFEKYALCKKIGEGAFGQVRLATSLATKKVYAVKVADVRARTTDPNHTPISTKRRNTIQREIAMWTLASQAAVPEITKLVDCFYSSGFYYMVCEACSKNLMQHLLHVKTISEDELGDVTAQMLRGISHMHNIGLVHRDVKPENFLFGGPNDAVLKLCDFGLVLRQPKKGRKLMGVGGTAPYMAPEILITGNSGWAGHRAGYDKEIDMWAMGVILYLVLYGQFPYMPSGEATAESMKQAIKQDLPPLRFEHSQAQTALSLVKLLLVRNPSERATTEQAAQHPFVARAARPPSGAEMEISVSQAKEVAEKLRDFKVDAATQAELEGRLKAMTAARGGVWFSESEALSPTHSQSSAAFRESRIKKDKKPVSRDKFGTHSGVVSEQQKEIETRADQWTT
mmetsp:Transcript_46497/g.101164  ORF Transcript_46497/g.101164 Transcript_46497/m.101164 type:complete len:413 (+) Transcript_46497:47-1285(+)